MSDKPDLNYEHECPICGSHRIQVEVKKTVIVQFVSNGDHTVIENDLHGDIEWDETSPAECSNCGHEAPLGEMHAK